MDGFGKNFFVFVYTYGIRRLLIKKKKRINIIIYEIWMVRINLKEYLWCEFIMISI